MNNDIEKLQKLLKEDPSNFQARRELSILLANNGFNEEALSNLQYLIKYFSDDAELYYNLGILYEKMQELEKAKKAYEKAISISPQEDFYYNLGEVLVGLKLWTEAIDIFKIVLKSDAKDANSYFNLGLCYYNLGEKNFAIDNLQQAIFYNPKDIYAYFYLACIYQSDGLTNFAEENYRKILEIAPDYSWAYYNLASIAYKNDNLEQAKEYLLKTIECNKQDLEAYKLLVKISVKQSEYEEIITILESRLEQEENGDLYYILAQVYKRTGDKENYARNLKLALENKLTLTFAKDIVLKEYNLITPDEDLNVEEVEEYDSDFYNDDYSSDESEEDVEEDFVNEEDESSLEDEDE